MFTFLSDFVFFFFFLKAPRLYKFPERRIWMPLCGEDMVRAKARGSWGGSLAVFEEQKSTERTGRSGGEGTVPNPDLTCHWLCVQTREGILGPLSRETKAS